MTPCCSAYRVGRSTAAARLAHALGTYQGLPRQPFGQTDDHDGTPIPFIPALAIYGHKLLEAMINDWWRTWSKRRPAPWCPGAELRHALRNGGEHMPSTALQEWLGAQGAEDPHRPLSGPATRSWLRVWSLRQVAAAANGRQDGLSGATTSSLRRRAYQAGSSMFRQARCSVCADRMERGPPIRRTSKRSYGRAVPPCGPLH